MKQFLGFKLYSISSNKTDFQTSFTNVSIPSGINLMTIELLINLNNEPLFIQTFRRFAYKLWVTMSQPQWSALTIKSINYDEIIAYSSPQMNNTLVENLDPEILTTFTNLNINLFETNTLPHTAVDAILDSRSIKTTYKKKLFKDGIIFCSISEAIKLYPQLIKKFLGLVIPSNDNFFVALNSAIFSDGSFCFIPKNTICSLNLSTYFRINNLSIGQFERTLIIAEKNSKINYLEGCTATRNSKNQLHAAVVELIAFNSAVIKYSTLQNWYSGTNDQGGIYNFVTKRGLALEANSSISWTQVETGSAITWKYPSCILMGKLSLGEFLSVAITKHNQQADTGTKMIHFGSQSKSKIISKGISIDNSKNIYRGLIKINIMALHVKAFSQCDSLLINNLSFAATYPYFDIANYTCKLEHEATISTITDEKIFYLLQRGLSREQSLNMLLTGFCNDVLIELPNELSHEVTQLLKLKGEVLTD